ncbi:MAG: phytanoyl-CoA dioxygenase family protein [Cyclobacteriaceae bacterium]
MRSTLQQLGVSSNTITKEEKNFLNENGYLNLGKLLSDKQLDKIRVKVQQLLDQEGDQAGIELLQSPHIRHPKEAGSTRLGDLVNKGGVFDVFYTQPSVLAAVSEVIGENFKLSSLNYRAANPGAGLQKLHVDWHETVPVDDFKVCNSIWLLDDFSKENGATRVVPKSHLLSLLPQDAMEDPLENHPEEIIIEAVAGSVVIFNSHAWHGGTTNLTTFPRRAIHSYFCRRDQPQQTDQEKFLTAATEKRLSKEALYILGIEAPK